MLITIVVVAFIGAVFWLAARQVGRARAHWGAVAQALGLEFRPGGALKTMEMLGQIDGLTVHVRTVSRNAGNHSQLFTVVDVAPTAPLPAGLRVHREGIGTRLIKALGGQDIPLSDPTADAGLRVRGDDPAAVRAVLDHPSAAPALRAVMDGAAHTRLEKETLTLEVGGYGIDALEALVRTAVAGARALDAAVQAPWSALAATHGLQHQETPGDATLSGEIDGLHVLVRAQRAGAGARTRIQVDLCGGLPPGVRIRAGAGGPRLGDPILDGRVTVETDPDDPAVHAAALRWLQARIQDPRHDLRGCLMDVLHGMPDACVESGSVRCGLPHRAGPGLPDLLRRMVALGAALSDPPAQGPAGGQRQRSPGAHRQRG